MAPSARKTRLLPAAEGFRFERAVQSHGWFDLPPFRWEPDAPRLARVVALPEGRAASVAIEPARVDGGPPALRMTLSSPGPIGRRAIDSAAAQVRRMLRLDEDFDEFYALARRVRRPDLSWAARAGAGRLLRAPSVFEDLVKMICTTNCTWALTRLMVGNLVERLGEEAPGGMRGFPTPEAMAARPQRFYRDVIRAGYRGAALRDLARAVARRHLDPEAWLDPARPTGEIRREILSVKGAGPYVADNMLKLLGRYDGMGIDSWCRRKFARMYHGGRRVADRSIERFYAPFGRWRGLAFWCDLTRDWFDSDDPPYSSAHIV